MLNIHLQLIEGKSSCVVSSCIDFLFVRLLKRTKADDNRDVFILPLTDMLSQNNCISLILLLLRRYSSSTSTK